MFANSPVSRVVATTDTSSQNVIDSILARAGSLHPDTSFLAFVASQRRCRVAESEIPSQYWLGSLDRQQSTQRHFFPSKAPSSRAEVYFVADVVDKMISDAAGSDRFLHVTVALFSGLRECSRHVLGTNFELGVLINRLTSALQSSFQTHERVVEKLKGEVAVARGYDPAGEIHDIHELLHTKDVQLSAAQRRLVELEAEAVRLNEQASAAATWKKARDDMAAVLVRQAVRNKAVLDAEIARLEIEQLKLSVPAGDAASDDDEHVLSYSDHAVQVNLDVKFDHDIGRSICGLVAVLQTQMNAVVDLCAPFYSKGGFQSVSRPAAVALGKLDEMATRITEMDRKATAAIETVGSHAGKVPAPVSKQLVTDVLNAAENAVRQLESRISALAQRSDIRKLAFPLTPPASSEEECQLCGRTEVDPELLSVASELERARSTIAQQAKAADLLHAERLALQDELEVTLARLTRQSSRGVAVETQTHGTFDASPPLQLNLIIEPRRATPPGPRRSSAKPQARGTISHDDGLHGPATSKQRKQSRGGPLSKAVPGRVQRASGDRTSDSNSLLHQKVHGAPASEVPIAGYLHPSQPAFQDEKSQRHHSNMSPINSPVDLSPAEFPSLRNPPARSAPQTAARRLSVVAGVPDDFGAGSSKTLMWILKTTDGVLGSHVRGNNMRTAVWTYFCATSASTDAARAGTASYVETIEALQAVDGRVSTLKELFEQRSSVGVDIVASAEQELKRSLSQTQCEKDQGKKPHAVALAVALDVVIACTPQTLAKFQPLLFALVASAFTTSEPWAAGLHEAALKRVALRWPQMPSLPEEAPYLKIQRWQLLRALCRIAASEETSLDEVSAWFSEGALTVQEQWRDSAHDSDSGTDSEDM